MKRSHGSMVETSAPGGTEHVLCCVCAGPMAPNSLNMCSNCLRTEVDVSEGISRKVVLPFCRDCSRYFSPPWTPCELESRELLAICLKKIKGLKKVKLVDASFLYTEPHSKRIKCRVAIQKEIGSGAVVQHEFVVEFFVTNQQCDDCKRNFTPHIWVAMVQVRQKAQHRRTLFYIEQLILKHDLCAKLLFVKQSPEGFDFHFASKSHALSFSQAVQSWVPCAHKESRQLVTHDAKNNSYKYKYTVLVDICPVSKDDVVYFPPKLRANNGGVGSLLLCTKVSTALSLVDIETFQGIDVACVKYYSGPGQFYPVCTRRHLTEFVVLDVENLEVQEKKTAGNHKLATRKRFQFCQLELVRVADFGVNDDRVITKSHLGGCLQAGDHVMGYDLRTINTSGIDDVVLQDYALPVIVVKKHYLVSRKKRVERRKWKLQRIAVQNEAKGADQDEEFAEFQDDLEEDAELRRGVNLYRDPSRADDDTDAARKKDAAPDSDEEGSDIPEVPLAELLDGLHLDGGMGPEEQEDPPSTPEDL